MKKLGDEYKIGLVLLSSDLKVVGLNLYAKEVLGPRFGTLGKSIYSYHPKSSHKVLRSILRNNRKTGQDAPLLKIIDVMGKILLINFGHLEIADSYQEPSRFMTFIDATLQTDARTNPESGLVEFNKFPVTHRGAHIFLDSDDIYLFESDGNYCHLFTADRSYHVQITLKTILKRYTGAHFFQVHKSYIANLNKIKKLQLSSHNKASIAFTHPEIPSVPVARRRIQLLKQALNLN